MKLPGINRKYFFFFIFLLLLCSLYSYYYLIIPSNGPFIPKYVSLRPRPSQNPFAKVSLAHYTTTYGIRTDSRSSAYDENLGQICEILDPEEYRSADNVIVSLVDFVHFPTIDNDRFAYRRKYASQFWVIHSEESPRNSYRSVKIQNITELDDWFNFTATLKTDSDFHIQYRGYRIKPEIGDLLGDKLNMRLKRTANSTSLPAPTVFPNGSSIYFDTLTKVLNRAVDERQDSLARICPYSCNQALPSAMLQAIQPFLKVPKFNIRSRNVVYIVWFVSNCHSHSGREDYVHRLRSQAGIHIDIYGYCSSKWSSHIVSMQCEKGTPKCLEQTLQNYRFYLSFENSKCDGYITEKYWMQGTSGLLVPIVLGAKREEYQQIAIPNSYIHVDDFPTVEDLAAKLHSLNRNDTEYNRYLQWTQLYDVKEDYSPSRWNYMSWSLCFLGHYRRLQLIKEKNEQIRYLIQRIRELFVMGQVKLPNFNWRTARTKTVKMSEFYNPKVNCWDNEYPSVFKRIYDYFFTWWTWL